MRQLGLLPPPPPVDRNAVPPVQSMVATFGLVREVKNSNSGDWVLRRAVPIHRSRWSVEIFETKDHGCPACVVVSVVPNPA
jgi:hypothetical protein